MEGFEQQLHSLGPAGAASIGIALKQDASKYTNTSDVEQFWALKTHKYAETYTKIITCVDPKRIRLTKFDDIIYRLFKRSFKNLNVEVLNDDDIKSDEAKKAWRNFCEQFKGKIENYNFGTLLRLDCNKDFTEDNTVLVSRIQFYAIELARNKQGLNKFHNNNTEELNQKIDNLNTCKEGER